MTKTSVKDPFDHPDIISQSTTFNELDFEGKREAIDYAVHVGGASLIGFMAAQYASRYEPEDANVYVEDLQIGSNIILPDEPLYKEQVGHFDAVLGVRLPSGLREQLRSGITDLPKGTLVHGITYDTEILEAISLTGVVARELSPDLVDELINDDVAGCAYFFKTEDDIPLHTFLNEKMAQKPMAQKVLPTIDANPDNVAFIFDARVDDAHYQALVNEENVDYGSRAKALDNDAVALPIGLPSGGIAGIVVGEAVAGDTERLHAIHTMFKDIPVIDTAGKVI